MVITGGEGGLGRALADEFSGAGWWVEAPGRSLLDVTNSGQVDAYFRGKQIDLLVCAAGIIRDRPLLKLGVEEWDEVMAVNLKGAVTCAKAACRSMIRQRSGHIVFISSYSALHPPAGQAAYAAAKAGLLGMTKSLARELGAFSVRVNAVLPGFMETRMTEKIGEIRRNQVLKEHLLETLNTPSCVGRFLRTLQEDLPHTSGQVFQLDSRVA